MFKQIAGSLGSIFASLCCLGFAPVLAALSAAGLGFAISDAILIPLLALFLGLTLWGLQGARARHGNNSPFYVGAAGAAAALGGIFIFIPLHVVGLLMVVGASLWDSVLLRKKAHDCQITTPSQGA